MNSDAGARWAWQVSVMQLACSGLLVRFCSANLFLARSAQKILGNYGFKDRVQLAGAFVFHKCEVACPKINKMHLMTTNNSSSNKIQKQSVACAPCCDHCKLERLFLHALKAWVLVTMSELFNILCEGS